MLVMNGMALGNGVPRSLVFWMTPPRLPLVTWRSKALPSLRLFARMHGVDCAGSPMFCRSSVERQP